MFNWERTKNFSGGIIIREEVNIEENSTALPPVSVELIDKLMSNSQFEFELDVHREHFVRNFLMLILFGIVVGGILGTIFFFILEYSSITNQYAILGIGTGVGLAFGIILGICMIIALRAKIIPDFGSSYGVGIGTNIFIGAIIGIIFGAIVGSLFGLILEATDYVLDTSLSYPLYGMLVWIVLGLNIGVLVGIITSFGFIDIIAGGAIAGCIVGPCGALAVFGPDWVAAAGVAAGFFVGIFIGIFSKYSVRASMGFITQPKCNPGEATTKIENNIGKGMERTRRRRRGYYRGGYYRDPCWGPTYSSSYACRNNDDSDDCGDEAGGCGQVILPIILMIFLAGAVILIIAFISWISVKASTKFGKVVKKGGLTAFGSSASILLIIGSDIGLTASFHNMEFYYLALIGAGIALVIGLAIFAGQALSIKQTTLKITPRTLSWKDGITQGNINFYNIEDFEFVIQLEDQENVPEYEGHLKLNLTNGTSRKICISCWKTPGDLGSSRHIQTILLHYLNQVSEIKAQQEAHRKRFESTVVLQDDKPKRRTYRESIEENKEEAKILQEKEDILREYSEAQISEVSDLVNAQKKLSADWVSRVTQIPRNKVIAISTIILGKYYSNGFILTEKPSEELGTQINYPPKKIQKVKDLVDVRNKISVAWLSKSTGIPEHQVVDIATRLLGRLFINGYIISDDIFE